MRSSATSGSCGTPYVSDNGYFFRADTVEDLAESIYADHEFQRVPLRYLAETVAIWNGYVEAGVDPDFEREAEAPMSPIMTPPFYALSIMVIWHDSYGGLRVNGRQQVVDMQGQVIPGLYAGGEAVGGFNKHGLGKGHVHGLHRRHVCRRRAVRLVRTAIPRWGACATGRAHQI